MIENLKLYVETITLDKPVFLLYESINRAAYSGCVFK
jgi:hypothetical protein